MKNKKKIVELKNVTKKFGGTVALDNVDFELFEGEVLGIVGDNGAGKSTLIKIISGVVTPNEGEIFIFGKKVNLKNPKDAIDLGVEVIYQDLALFGGLDFTTNIFTGREYLKKGAFSKIFKIIDVNKMEKKAEEVLSGIAFNMPPVHEYVENFSGGQKQAVAVSRAKLWGKEIIIMDEPTAAMGVQESQRVLDMIKDFSKVVKGLIVISHNIEHVISVTNRIIVLRQGRRAGTIECSKYRDKEALHTDVVKLISGLEFKS